MNQFALLDAEPGGGMIEKENRDIYWPNDPDPQKIVSTLIAKRAAYWNFLVQSGFEERIQRNWRYYLNLYYPQTSWRGMELQTGGENGEFVKIAVNHFRSMMQSIKTYVCKDKPSWDTRAINNDNEAMQAADLGNNLLDYYMEQGGEETTDLAVEHGLIFALGYLYLLWDEDMGEERNPAYGPVLDQNGAPLHEGDLRFLTPTYRDVIYDFSYPNYRDSRWKFIRTPRNRWELIEKYGDEFKNDILNAPRQGTNDDLFYPTLGYDGIKTDMVDFWEFYHERTTLCPDGIYMPVVGTKALEDPQPLPKWCSKKVPLFRFAPAPFLMTSFGYTPAFDLQGIQEAINAEVSTVITNHKNLGPTKLWIKSGETVNLADLEPGTSLIQTDTQPVPLQLQGISRENLQFKDSLVRDGEYVSGMNSVARGQPQDSLRSASAVEFIEGKAEQYTSTITANYHRFLAEVGTGVLNVLKAMADTPRVVYIAGKNNRTELKNFTATQLEPINCVAVTKGNSRNKAAMANMATQLLQAGLLKTPEEYFTVRSTGQLRPLTEANDSQLKKVHDENEKLRQGQGINADILDNHRFHILKHQAILDSVDMANDPTVAPAVKAHIMSHIEILTSIQGATMQTILGYPVPVPPVTGGQIPPGGPGEAQPGQQPEGPTPSGNMGGMGASEIPEPGNEGMPSGGNEPGGMP